jgi:hypothetical protein
VSRGAALAAGGALLFVSLTMLTTDPANVRPASRMTGIRKGMAHR